MTWDLDRVEVLRGPQGVLFGSGSLGGALRYLFNKPRFGEFEASVKGEYAKASGGDREFSLYGMVNAPLSAGRRRCARSRSTAATQATSTTSAPAQGRERHAPDAAAACS